jgi:hypothetical protein
LTVEQPRQEKDLAHKGQDRHDINVAGVVVIGHNGGNACEEKRLDGEEPNVREQHLLHDHEDLHHEHQRGHQRDELRPDFG